MKKVICILLLLLMFAVPLTGCGSDKDDAQKNLESAQRAASELEENYQKQKSEYEDLKKDIEEYKQDLSRLEAAN